MQFDQNCNIAYGLDACETRSLTLREEHLLRVAENSVLRRIFGPKVDKVTGIRISGFHGGDYEECRLLVCGAVRSCKNRHSGGMFRFHLQGRKNTLARKLLEVY
jgi:hypothetical protein